MNLSSLLLGALAFLLFRLIARVDVLEKDAKEQSGKLESILRVLEAAHGGETSGPTNN